MRFFKNLHRNNPPPLIKTKVNEQMRLHDYAGVGGGGEMTDVTIFSKSTLKYILQDLIFLYFLSSTLKQK